MDNLINYTQKINKRHQRPAFATPKKRRKNFFSGFSLFTNIFNFSKNRLRKKIPNNKVSYKPFTMQDKQSKSQSFKNSLKGQYIILPQQLINHVSSLLKRSSNNSVLNRVKDNFFKHIKPIFVKFSFFNIFIIIIGLSVAVSTSIYSSSFVPAGTITLPNDTNINYHLKSFMARGDSANKNLVGTDADLSLLKGLQIRQHTVARGETISTIAQRYNLEQGTIISFNNIQNARTINAGAVLRIPDKDGLFYRVRQGDSLSAIASRHRVSLNAILDINNLDSPVIRPGQELFIPGAKMDRFELKRALGELFIFPTQGRLTSPFGFRNDPFTGRRSMHNGIDIANSIGTPVRAAADGKIAMTGNSSVYGRFIIIQHPGRYQSLYAHLDRIRVREGERVTQGQLIGDMGNTGRSTGPHLHFAIYRNQRPIDPLTVLSR